MENNKEALKISKQELAKEVLESGEGIQVTWLEGKAPEQQNDQPVRISGTISAPRLFLEKREGEFYDKTAHALVSRTDGKIDLVINEHTVDEKYTIIGKVEIGKKFTELNINNFSEGIEPLKLVQKLRLRRSIFKSHLEHTTLLATLSNVEAKIKKEMDESKDDRANYNFNHRQTVTSNIPKSFDLRIPIIEGEDPVEIEVQVLLELDGNGRIMCYLESVDGADLIETAFETLVDTEVESFKEKVTVIYR
jgi:hypothetical protein